MGIILRPKVEKSILFLDGYSSSNTSIAERIPHKIKGQLVLEAKNTQELLEIVEMVNIDLVLIDSIDLDAITIKNKRNVFDLRKEIKLLLFNSSEINSGIRLVERDKEIIISQLCTQEILFRALKKIIYKENYNWD